MGLFNPFDTNKMCFAAGIMFHEELENRDLGFTKKHGSIQLLNAVLPREAGARERAHDLYDRILQENYSIEPRESNGHSPSFLLIGDKPFAILKQSFPEFYCSFKKFLPHMPLSAAVWEHELIAYEQDVLFKFHHVPITLAVRFKADGNFVNGIVQEYIPNSKDGTAFYTPEGAYFLKNLPNNRLQRLALSGFFKGISGGQVSNYLIQDEKIFEVDLETLLMPYNRLGGSLILCRMWILGFPQCNLPFDQEVLKEMADSHLLKNLSDYHKMASSYSRIDQESWQAQYERVAEMNELIIQELQKEKIQMTPRDLYFALFGGKHLWKIAQEKHYPAMMAFNNFISDPYQYILKNFEDLESIPISERLEKPKDKSKESKDIMNFYRIMENLDPY